MANPVVHFEIIGPEPDLLRTFYRELFGWTAPPGSPVAPEISETHNYSFIDTGTAADVGIPGGIGGGTGYSPQALFYVGVEDVASALSAAERLGGSRVLGPAHNEEGQVTVGHFRDPAGNLVGVAGPH